MLSFDKYPAGGIRATLRIVGRCIQLNRHPGKYRRWVNFRRGGQLTRWPWWTLQIWGLEMSHSRIHPRRIRKEAS